MDPKRINIKFFLEDDQAIAPAEAFKIFNNWIAAANDEVLVDVSDYSHVGEGPVTLLVGHEADYCIDNTDGKLGLLYTRKQPLPGGSLSEKLAAAIGAALRACQRLEQDPTLEGRAKFRGSELLLAVNDRLRGPNSEETLQSIRPDLDAVLEKLYAGSACTVERDADADRLFTLCIRNDANLEVATLLQNIGA